MTGTVQIYKIKHQFPTGYFRYDRIGVFSFVCYAILLRYPESMDVIPAGPVKQKDPQGSADLSVFVDLEYFWQA